ncbi:hypothetical protein A3F66_06240 [candidate division TM6 bacterium RIFCSPHIGHO2_12_FULL_32_22]|nr:MAG: hypothetical protein A3F66_06240 [candidate division TM6 bacterium RIFCSPHIGHO2_12_FULL_32_22]
MNTLRIFKLALFLGVFSLFSAERITVGRELKIKLPGSYRILDVGPEGEQDIFNADYFFNLLDENREIRVARTNCGTDEQYYDASQLQAYLMSARQQHSEDEYRHRQQFVARDPNTNLPINDLAEFTLYIPEHNCVVNEIITSDGHSIDPNSPVWQRLIAFSKVLKEACSLSLEGQLTLRQVSFDQLNGIRELLNNSGNIITFDNESIISIFDAADYLDNKNIIKLLANYIINNEALLKDLISHRIDLFKILINNLNLHELTSVSTDTHFETIKLTDEFILVQEKDHIKLIDPRGAQTIRQLSGEFREPFITENGKFIIAINNDDIVVIRSSDLQIVKRINGLQRRFGSPSISPDGKFIVALDYSNMRYNRTDLTIIEVENPTNIRIVQGNFSHPLISPHGFIIAINNNLHSLAIVDIVTTNTRYIGGNFVGIPEISPDGQFVVVIDQGHNNNLAVIDITTEPVGIRYIAGSCSNASINHNGTIVALDYNHNRNIAIRPLLKP